MQNFCSLLLFLLVSFSPVVGQSIDVKHIRLELSFDWEKRTCTGKEEISLSPVLATRFIRLDAAQMSIAKVGGNGKNFPITYESARDSGQLRIELDRVYREGEILTISIDYTTQYVNESDPENIGGSFGKGLRFFSPSSTAPLKRKQLWSSGDPTGNSYWFPCHEAIEDIHTMEVLATVDTPLSVISNGAMARLSEMGNGTRTFHYRSEKPLPACLVFIAVGHYLPFEQTSGATRIITYGYPDEMEAVKATVEGLPDMVRFLEEKTGMEYPFGIYRQVVVQDYPFPGRVGQQGTVLISDNYIDDYGVHKDYKYLWDGVAMQALANQWFGNLIRPKQWNELWLSNAFAEYFAGLYTEKCFGRDEYLIWYYPFEKGNVLSDWTNGNIHPIVPEKIADLPAFVNDSYSKYRGALVLRMLQYEAGEAIWWKAMRYFVKKYAFQRVTLKDFQRTIEEVSGRSFQWFFDQWYFRTGFPQLTVRKTYDPAKKQLLLRVDQTQVPTSDTTITGFSFFQGKIPVEIDGVIRPVQLKPVKTNEFLFPFDREPSFVNFNAGQIFLCERVEEKAIRENLAQIQGSKDAFARREALNQLAATIASGDSLEERQEVIRSVMTSEVSSNRYWRYRWAALGALSQLSQPPYSEAMTALLTGLIARESGWLKAAAIGLLGNSRDSSFLGIYVNALSDPSDRVINAAAIAIGKTGSSRAFDYLMELENRKSWKNQNRISALNGLQQLRDDRAADYALSCITDNQSPRWYLGTPLWDYPFAAVNTLVALGQGHRAYPFLLDRLKGSLKDNDRNDIFQNVQLIQLLGLKQSSEIYILLKQHFHNDSTMLAVIQRYETSFQESISK